MSESSRICSATIPDAPHGAFAPALPEQAPSTAGAANAAAGAVAIGDATSLLLGIDVLGDHVATARGFEHVARFGDHLFGSPQYADSSPGRVVAAAVETAAGAIADDVLGDALERAAGSRVAIGAAVVNALDAALAVDDAPKVLTAFAAGVQPATVGVGAASLLADLGTVAAGPGGDRAVVTIGSVESDLAAGGYGAVLQGASLAGAVLADPAGTAERVTSDTFARGEAGVFAAWGNAAGDLWADVIHGEGREPRMVPVHEAERRPSLLGF